MGRPRRWAGMSHRRMHMPTERLWQLRGEADTLLLRSLFGMVGCVADYALQRYSRKCLPHTLSRGCAPGYRLLRGGGPVRTQYARSDRDGLLVDQSVRGVRVRLRV